MMEENENEIQEERRQYVRIKKNFILSYYPAENPSTKKDASQLKNISKGGICIITSSGFKPGIKMVIELRTPYISDVTCLNGIVLESHEQLANIIYETRLQFENLSPQAEYLLEKLEEYFEKEKDNHLS